MTVRLQLHCPNSNSCRLSDTVLHADVGAEVLCNCRKNVDANAASFKHGPQVAQVRQLDWLEPLPQSCPQSSAGDDPSIDFSWCEEDVQALQHAQVSYHWLCLLLDVVVHSLLRQAAVAGPVAIRLLTDVAPLAAVRDDPIMSNLKSRSACSDSCLHASEYALQFIWAAHCI